MFLALAKSIPQDQAVNSASNLVHLGISEHSTLDQSSIFQATNALGH